MPYKDKEKQKEFSRKHYQENKLKYRESTQNRRNNRKSWFNSIKKECVCAICGMDDFRCLDFHHVGVKKFGIAEAVKQAFPENVILEELEKCVVLCANCHRITHVNLNGKSIKFSPRIKKLVLLVNDYKSKKGCSDCGDTRSECLDLHHLMQSRRKVSNMVLSGYSLEAISEEIEKCEVLCANCHRKKHEGNVWYCDCNFGGVV